VQEILNRDGIKRRQVFGWNNLFMRNDLDLVMSRVQEFGELVVSHDEEDLAHKGHVGFDGSQAILDLIIVIIAIIPIFLAKRLDFFHEFGVIAIDPGNNYINRRERWRGEEFRGKRRLLPLLLLLRHKKQDGQQEDNKDKKYECAIHFDFIFGQQKKKYIS